MERHLAKQHQDAAENIPADVVLLPPQPQCLKFKAVEEEEPPEYIPGGNGTRVPRNAAARQVRVCRRYG
jgi:hypothetical protein